MSKKTKKNKKVFSTKYKNMEDKKNDSLHDAAAIQFEYLVDEVEIETIQRQKDHQLSYHLGAYSQSATKDFCSISQKAILLTLPIILILTYLCLPTVAISLFFSICILIHLFSIITKQVLFFKGKNVDLTNYIMKFNAQDLRRNYLKDKTYNGDEKNIVDEKKLPLYSILLPVFMEGQNVLEQLITAINSINYPERRLQVLLILETIDKETLNIVNNMELPDNWEKIIVPDFQPRTKAKACNYALQFVRGEYVVIFDADDIPDADQLHTAIAKFTIQSDDKLACLQAKLNYYNADENFLTRFFSIEYTILFNFILPAFAKGNYPIPLGGTSNHFRTEIIKKLKGWDIYNLAEDAEIGMRLAMQGYSVDIIDSYTAEESPVTITAWIKQRTRWFKGFIQTYLLYTQHKNSIHKSIDYKKSLVAFHFILGLSVISLITIPIMLGFGCLTFVGILANPNLELNTKLLSISLASGLIWVITSIYQAFIAIGKSPFSKDYSLSKKVLCTITFPLYFSLHIIAAINSLLDLIRRPFYWSRTKHGLSKIKQKISNIRMR